MEEVEEFVYVEALITNTNEEENKIELRSIKANRCVAAYEQVQVDLTKNST